MSDKAGQASVATFPPGTPDVLQKICARTLQDLAERKTKTPLNDIKTAAYNAPPPRGFIQALKEKAASGSPALIAEIKKASPSKGLIRQDFAPAELAELYEQGGAACLSVLTDSPFFQGRPEYLIQAKSACSLPILRKDFMLDAYQICESRALGADCILLIVAALDDPQMQNLYNLAKDLGRDVLVEVHNLHELERAKALNADMIGVNNRNLKTLEVSIETSHALSKAMPHDCLRVAESGIFDNSDIKNLQQSGYNTFLVGESLMRQADVKKATAALLGH